MTRLGAGAFAASVAVLAGSCIAPVPREATAAAAPAPPPMHVAPPPRTPEVRSGPIVLTGVAVQGGIMLGQLAPGTLNLTLDGQPVRVAPDGRFIIGFNSDAAPTAMLRATARDGRGVELPLKVEPRAWRVETIAGLPRFAQPSAEFARLRPPELAQINAARRIDGGADGWRQRFIWPVKGRISGLFGSSRVYANGEKGAPHSGVDVARPTGTPVVAPADGVVTLAAAQPFTLEGKILMIDHGMGLNSAFLHLSRHDVKVGDRVRQGQVVGAVGMTGRASGPHLHWGMKWLDRRIDPLLLAGPQ
ncbi:M23 family metallopeptidase [Sphingomonas sp. SUN039]|uniref:M23 family metallopeptidase n=1 Tax=Sphingomonas sp. SUN039 TaxID=2937787 RepID=UPI002164DC95|nr:M23 family metallopeptidase [Sphingomonas sp. SUN039]UVO54929.1 M23 family metallopeptidase [Sphingomonas sp. SUN039]